MLYCVERDCITDTAVKVTMGKKVYSRTFSGWIENDWKKESIKISSSELVDIMLVYRGENPNDTIFIHQIDPIDGEIMETSLSKNWFVKKTANELFVVTDRKNEEIVSVFSLKFSGMDDREECYKAIAEALDEYNKSTEFEGYNDILLRKFQEDLDLSYHAIKFEDFTEIDVSDDYI